MNYTDLKARVKDIVENEFTDSQLDLFTKQAEQYIYETAQPPAIRQNEYTTLTSGNRYLSLPTGYRHAYSFAVTDSSGNMSFMLNKDVNFIREAYPGSQTGVPKHYAQFDEDSFILGPIPDSNYQVELHYAGFPQSIVDSGTSNLGETFDNVLLNGVLVEAGRFLKFNSDELGVYEKMFKEALGLYKMWADGKTHQDTYRSGEAKTNVA